MDALHFLFEDLGLLGGEPRAAIGFGPVGHGIALRHARFEPRFLGVVLEHPVAAAPADVPFVTHGLAHFGGAIGLQPFAHLGAESVQFAHPLGSSSALKSTSASPRSEEHTSELQSLMRISYAVFCLKKKKNNSITPLPSHISHTTPP